MGLEEVRRGPSYAPSDESGAGRPEERKDNITISEYKEFNGRHFYPKDVLVRTLARHGLTLPPDMGSSYTMPGEPEKIYYSEMQLRERGIAVRPGPAEIPPAPPTPTEPAHETFDVRTHESMGARTFEPEDIARMRDALLSHYELPGYGDQRFFLRDDLLSAGLTIPDEVPHRAVPSHPGQRFYSEEDLGAHGISIPTAGEAPPEGTHDTDGTREDVGEFAAYSRPTELLPDVRELSYEEVRDDPDDLYLVEDFWRMAFALDRTRASRLKVAEVLQEEGERRPNREDARAMHDWLNEFANRLELGRRIRNHISEPLIEVAKRRNEAFRNDARFRDSQSTRDLVMQGVRTLAMTMPYNELLEAERVFDVIESQIEGPLKRNRREIEMLLAGAGMPSGRFNTIRSLQGDQGAYRQLASSIAEQPRSGFSWTRSQTPEERAESIIQDIRAREEALAEELDASSPELEEALNYAAGFLSRTLTDDPSKRSMLLAKDIDLTPLTARVPDGAPDDATPNDVARKEIDQLIVHKDFTPVYMQELFDEAKKDRGGDTIHINGRTYNELETEMQKLAWRDAWFEQTFADFREKRRRTHREYPGYWSNVFDVLLDDLLHERRERLEL